MEDAIAAVRAFNRFYTRLIGALDDRFLGADLTLPEARLLFEAANADRPVAVELQARLGMDAGFVSRLLRRFEARGWIVREHGGADARRRPIVLTDAGRAMVALIDQRQRAAVTAMLQRLAPAQQRDLIAALGQTTAMLDPALRQGFSLRTFRIGDLAMLAARQSILYDEVYGWGRGLELVESEYATQFLRDFKPGREQCWIAEAEGAMAGSVMLTDEGKGLARLRLMYVEPFARGRGIGDALVGTCLAFARGVGYEAITLWTHTVLTSARKIYAGHGFAIIETEIHEAFGKPEQGEIWRLELK
jgi:DNA-binding MarR family transcriptional regulator/N-acetylglutamate synthase-like GNAT family acetyltransferase